MPAGVASPRNWLVEVVVEAALGHELVVAADVDHPAVVDRHDHVRVGEQVRLPQHHVDPLAQAVL
jgi:hypothetical protein